MKVTLFLKGIRHIFIIINILPHLEECHCDFSANFSLTTINQYMILRISVNDNVPNREAMKLPETMERVEYGMDLGSNLLLYKFNRC